MRIIQGSALFIVILFGLFGAIALGIVLHEYSHAQDFSQVAENEEICALTIPTDSSKLVSMGLAYYSFEADSSNPKAEEEIERISENIPAPNPITTPKFSLLAVSMIGRITAAKIPRNVGIKKVAKPRPIAQQAVFVFGFSLNLLIISFFIFKHHYVITNILTFLSL